MNKKRFYEITNDNGLLEIKRFLNEEEARKYVAGLPEYLSAKYREISKDEAEEKETKRARRLIDTLSSFNKGISY